MPITLTTTSYLVLGLVARQGTATPYDLKRAVFHTLEYFWAFPHSQLYAEPERLKKAGYLAETRERGGRRRRSFSITEKGRDALAAWLREPTEALIEIRDLGLLKLYFGELGSAKDVRTLAEQQAELHRQRLDEYEALCAARQGADTSLVYPLAVLEMGLLFERAAIAFWTAVAAQPPGLSKRLQPKLDVEGLSTRQPATPTPKPQRKKAQSPLLVELETESEKFPTSDGQFFNGSFEPGLTEEFEEREDQEPLSEELPDHLL